MRNSTKKYLNSKRVWYIFGCLVVVFFLWLTQTLRTQAIEETYEGIITDTTLITALQESNRPIIAARLHGPINDWQHIVKGVLVESSSVDLPQLNLISVQANVWPGVITPTMQESLALTKPYLVRRQGGLYVAAPIFTTPSDGYIIYRKVLL